MTTDSSGFKPVKTVWVISDGIPGHFNQSKGILLALEQLYDLNVEWIELYLKSGIYRRVLSWLLNCCVARQVQLSTGLISFFYRGKLPSGQPDIVIGAGGKSMFAVGWLGQALAAKTIFAGSLRQLSPALFDAVLVLEPDLQPPFMTLQTSPMPISQSLLQQAAARWQAEQPQLHSPEKPFWAMLIGGNGAGASYQEGDWYNLALQMNSIAEKHGIQWLVTTSRRTGSSAEHVLKQHLNASLLADAVWWSEAERPVTSAYLGLAQVVCCTIDSMSMIMESVSAMRPVIAVMPQQFKPEHNFQQAINRLQQQNLLLQAEMSQLGMSSNAAFQLQPLKLEPATQLANQLKTQLSRSD